MPPHSSFATLMLTAFVAKAFPIDSTSTFAEIARAVNVDETNVRRLIRHAMTNRVFKEVSPGVVAHTAASRVLAEDKLMDSWVGCKQDEHLHQRTNQFGGSPSTFRLISMFRRKPIA